MRIQIQGPNAAAVAAELRQHFDAAELSHTTLKEPPIAVRSAALTISIIGLALSLPGAIKNTLDLAERRATMKDKLAQQAAVDALKARVAALEAKFGDTEVIAVRDDGEAWRWH